MPSGLSEQRQDGSRNYHIDGRSVTEAEYDHVFGSGRHFRERVAAGMAEAGRRAAIEAPLLARIAALEAVVAGPSAAVARAPLDSFMRDCDVESPGVSEEELPLIVQEGDRIFVRLDGFVIRKKTHDAELFAALTEMEGPLVGFPPPSSGA